MSEKLTKEEFRERMRQASIEYREKEERLAINTFPKFVLFGLGPIIGFGLLFGFLNYISIPESERVTDSDLRERSVNQSKYFYGYRCIDDCSGHEAGYTWAKENDVMFSSDCPETSKSFNEGCRVWTGN
jgi:hypothetical protein